MQTEQHAAASAAGGSCDSHPKAGSEQPLRIAGEKPLPHQQFVPQEQPAADRLSQALRNFGLGVVTMQQHDTPVPFGHFWVTAMCQAAGEQSGNSNVLMHSYLLRNHTYVDSYGPARSAPGCVDAVYRFKIIGCSNVTHVSQTANCTMNGKHAKPQ